MKQGFEGAPQEDQEREEKAEFTIDEEGREQFNASPRAEASRPYSEGQKQKAEDILKEKDSSLELEGDA